MTASLISLINALRLMNDALERDAHSLLLLSPDVIEKRVADCHTLVLECDRAIGEVCRPLSPTETETLRDLLTRLSYTLKVYRHVLRAAQRSCCGAFATVDPGLQLVAWKG